MPAQMVPDAPIENFRLPMFGDDGYKTWELRGNSGEYIEEGHAVIKGLDLRVFSGDEAMLLETRILSPRADIYFDDAKAESDSSLFVSGPGYKIEGSHWSWDGKNKTILVQRRARVSFEQEINILK